MKMWKLKTTESNHGKVLDLLQAACFGVRRFVDAKSIPHKRRKRNSLQAKRYIRNAMARNSRRLNRV